MATIRWEYRFVPTSPLLRFSCVSDLDTYRELMTDPASTATWYFEPVDGLNASSSKVFELVQVAVNGKPQKARRSVRKEDQVFTVGLGGELKPGEPVTVSYTYRVLVQHGHVLHLDLAQPTKDFRAELWYGDCGIRYMNVLDYLSGPRQPRYTELAASAPSPNVEVAYEGWTFPKGGVAFVSVLEREMHTITS
ncbi:hypothetical protein NW249_18410 [Streptomyces sp. OUCMDZ-4982]|uniref:hypothetical protein n=1 Tax=Streptomyces sp. OUCMDZ-4982 TaxID=2973090 RepID=UPI00215C6AE7|nr:hypothetical protein [Streptomyces sp. OUCMDZ-4982]MCR8944096.1 hypothetical protein [Streptomyces sp. OUCMDZ-4982]